MNLELTARIKVDCEVLGLWGTSQPHVGLFLHNEPVPARHIVYASVQFGDMHQSRGYDLQLRREVYSGNCMLDAACHPRILGRKANHPRRPLVSFPLLLHPWVNNQG